MVTSIPPKYTLVRDEALLRQAELNLSYTNIVSPADGVVGNRRLRAGQYVQAGTLLMAVVPTAPSYIIANYKETQLTNVSKYPPAKPGALGCEPLKAAGGVE
jgi:membrane fusion protein (multidrug efflux system)